MAELRFILLSFDYWPKLGGISTYSVELAEALHRRHPGQVLVIAPGTGVPAAEPGRCPVRRIYSPRPALLAAIFFAWELTRIWWRHPRAMVLATNWSPAGVAAWLSPARWLRGGSYALSAHGAEFLDRPGRSRLFSGFRRSLRARVLASSAAVYPVSHYTAGKVAAAAGKRKLHMRVIPNGVNVEKFFPAPNPRPARALPVVASVCRLEPHKGIDTALRALALASECGRPFAYRIAGSGRDESRLRQLAEELGISRYVSFLPGLNNEEIRALYHDCDLFLLLSRESRGAVEGFGLVFLEAAACGKTAVATAVGGIPDAVIHGQTGLVVAPDSPKEAADAILRLLEDLQLREQLEKRALLRARTELSWDHAAGKISAGGMRG